MAVAVTRPHDHEHPELARFSVATPELFSQRVATEPDSAYVLDGGEVHSLAAIAGRVSAAQRALVDVGVGRGDVVSMQLPNWHEAVVLAHAVWGLGAVLNPITPVYRGAELRAIFGSCRPAAVVVPHLYRGVDRAAMVRDALDEASVDAPTLIVRGRDSAFLRERSGDDVIVTADVDDICLLMYTSGTTGRPKGVLHSHRTLLCEAGAIVDRFGLDADRVFMPSPLTHITGLIYGVLMPLVMNGDVSLLDAWDPTAAVGVIESEQCTVCVGATPFLRGLVDVYSQRGSRSSIDTFICGGADVPPHLIRDASGIFTTVVRAYGLTEMPVFSCGSPDDSVAVRSHTDGHVVGTSCGRLVDESGGVGELEVHGPQMFLGYLDAADNAAAFTEDGWFRTGDLARLSGDTVTIAGRKKDIIVRGGENIGAREIEDLLIELPEVADIALVGVPDEVLGERACAVVVPATPGLRLATLAEHLERAQVARQKFPEFLLLCDALPRTASGKIQKYRVAADAAERLAAGEGESR